MTDSAFDELTPPYERPDFHAPLTEPVAASPARRRMKLEWFTEACALALCNDANPLIVDLLDDGTMSVIYGESNAGKTFFVLDMAFAVATGLLWNGKETRRGLIVYVAAEGGKRITRRLAALRQRYLEAYGEDADEPSFALIRFPIDLRSNDANLKELLALVRGAEEARGEKCVWIIVDTLSRAIAGGDENSPVDMGMVVKSADRIRADTGAHFTYVHHTGKDNARGARGHSLLRAATDTEIEVASELATVTKQRDMEGGQKFAFSLVDIGLGEDSAGLPVKSAVVEWRDGPVEKKRSGAEKIPEGQRLLLDTFDLAVGEAGEDFRPAHDSPLVRAVDDEAVRSRYYARIAEKPKDGDTPKKMADRQRQAFNTAIKKLLDSRRLIAGENKGRRLLWRP